MFDSVVLLNVEIYLLASFIAAKASGIFSF